VRENQQLVSEAVRRLQREQYAPFIPSILLGASYGNFGAGLGGAVGNYGDRFDGDAFAWWEVRNFGAGEAAARKEMNARIELAQWRQLQMLDQIAREVAEAHAQVTMRKQQVETARDAIGFARDSYGRNLVRIENAQGLPLEALQSIQALGQAKREYLRSVTDYNLAQFSLCRALGWPDTVPDME
jgi:outer membrane protein TolC